MPTVVSSGHNCAREGNSSHHVANRAIVPLIVDLDDNLGLNLSRAYTVAMYRLESRLAPISLTPKAASILWKVEGEPGISQSDLARFFQINRAYVYTVCSSLIERGLLLQGYSNGDKRRRGLSITDEGMLALADAKLIIVEHEEWLSRGMSQLQRYGTVEALKVITSGLRANLHSEE